MWVLVVILLLKVTAAALGIRINHCCRPLTPLEQLSSGRLSSTKCGPLGRNKPQWTEEGFPGGASGNESPCQCRRHKIQGSIPGSGRSPWGGHDNPMHMATHSSILAWRIPWTEKPGSDLAHTHVWMEENGMQNHDSRCHCCAAWCLWGRPEGSPAQE